MKKFYVVLMLVALTSTLSAQKSLTEGAFENGRWSVAGELGFSRWNGDFHPTTDQFLNGFVRSPLIGLSAEYNISPLLGMGVMMGGYFLSQNDDNERYFSRGVYVAPYLSTDIFGLLNAEKLKYWSLWGSAGVGIINPIRTRYGRVATPTPGTPIPVNTVTAPPTMLMLPFSLTLERKISPTLSLGLSARFNASNSDELDGLVRGDFNDHFQNLALQVRYRILPESKQHYRDEKFQYQSPYIRAIQANINRIDELQKRVEELEKRLNQK